jgi:hypothetical protein
VAQKLLDVDLELIVVHRDCQLDAWYDLHLDHGFANMSSKAIEPITENGCEYQPPSSIDRKLNLFKLSPNSNILLPRVQRASFADVKQESLSHLDLVSPPTGGNSEVLEELQVAIDEETKLNFKSNNDEDIPE